VIPRRHRLLVFASFLGLTACADSDAELASMVTVRDSAGVEVVEQSLIVVPRVNLTEPYMQIGSVDGEDDALYRVTAIDRFADGSWAVVNQGSTEVRVFGEDGTFLRAIGAQGSGPGELSQLTMATVLPGDSVLAWDMVGRRGVVFSSAGDFIRDVRLGSRLDGALVLPVGVMGNRVVMTTASLFSSDGGDGSRVLRPSTEGFIVDGEARVTSELGEIPGAEAWYSRDGSSTSIRSFPYRKTGVATVAGERVVIGDSGSEDLEVYDASGNLVAIWRVVGEPERVTGSDWDAQRQRTLADTESASDRRAAQAMFDQLPPPARRPAWSALLGSEDGSLWVRQYADEGETDVGEWWVVSPEGEVVREVTMPVDFKPAWTDGEVVAGRVTDELDVEYLRFYRVPGNEGDDA